MRSCALLPLDHTPCAGCSTLGCCATFSFALAERVSPATLASASALALASTSSTISRASCSARLASAASRVSTAALASASARARASTSAASLRRALSASIGRRRERPRPAGLPPLGSVILARRAPPPNQLPRRTAPFLPSTLRAGSRRQCYYPHRCRRSSREAAVSVEDERAEGPSSSSYRWSPSRARPRRRSWPSRSGRGAQPPRNSAA
eukprot:scaffold11855_cov61-Phaeocystis_antarctica.AAC.5